MAVILSAAKDLERAFVQQTHITSPWDLWVSSFRFKSVEKKLRE